MFLGIALSLVSSLVLKSTPITALGISAFIIGSICIALARTRPNISPEASAILLETGIENTAAIIEELGLTSNAIYIPSSATREGGNAVIPINSKGNSLQIMHKIPKRLITKYGTDDNDIGIMVATPGSACLRLSKNKPGATASEIESAITTIIAGALDIADSARVNIADGKAVIIITNPRLKHKDIKFYQYIGSPLASIAATLVCEAIDKPLVIEEENQEKGKTTIQLRILA